MRDIERKLYAVARADAQVSTPEELPAAVRNALPAAARKARLTVAQRQERRVRRRETLLFAAAVFMLLSAGAIWVFKGGTAANWRDMLVVPGIGAGLLLLLAPLMGYVWEEENSDEA